MRFPDHAIAFVVNITATAGFGIQFFIDSHVDIAAAAGVHLAVIGCKIVAVEITAAAGMHMQPGSGTTDIGIRTAGLLDGQITDSCLAMQVTAAR